MSVRGFGHGVLNEEDKKKLMDFIDLSQILMKPIIMVSGMLIVQNGECVICECLPACQLEGKYCLLPFSSVGSSPLHHLHFATLYTPPQIWMESRWNLALT